MSDRNQSNDHQMSASEEMFPIVNRELFDAVVALNAANGVKANELNRILQDLIAELRAIYDHDYGDDTYLPPEERPRGRYRQRHPAIAVTGTVGGSR